jgi:hypothetical protein
MNDIIEPDLPYLRDIDPEFNLDDTEVKVKKVDRDIENGLSSISDNEVLDPPKLPKSLKNFDYSHLTELNENFSELEYLKDVQNFYTHSAPTAVWQRLSSRESNTEAHSLTLSSSSSLDWNDNKILKLFEEEEKKDQGNFCIHKYEDRALKNYHNQYISQSQGSNMMESLSSKNRLNVKADDPEDTAMSNHFTSITDSHQIRSSSQQNSSNKGNNFFHTKYEHIYDDNQPDVIPTFGTNILENDDAVLSSSYSKTLFEPFNTAREILLIQPKSGKIFQSINTITSSSQSRSKNEEIAVSEQSVGTYDDDISSAGTSKELLPIQASSNTPTMIRPKHRKSHPSKLTQIQKILQNTSSLADLAYVRSLLCSTQGEFRSISFPGRPPVMDLLLTAPDYGSYRLTCTYLLNQILIDIESLQSMYHFLNDALDLQDMSKLSFTVKRMNSLLEFISSLAALNRKVLK